MSRSEHDRPRRVEPLRDLAQVEALRTASWQTAGVRLRSGVVDRLMVAQTLMPRALRFLIVAGHQLAGSACPHDHATGGAVDLTAYLDGSPEPVLWSATPPPEWPAAAGALGAVGMVNGGPWWHWSFGDARWCSHVGGSTPLYDATT